MPLAHLVLLLSLAAPAPRSQAHDGSAQPASAAFDLERARRLLDESDRAHAAADHATARAKAAEASASLLAASAADEDEGWAELAEVAGRAAWRSRDLATARAVWQRVLDAHSRALPGDDRRLQAARANLAAALGELGDLAGARALEEHVVEVFSRTLPEGHPELQTARLNLASTLRQLGDLAGARALQERVLEVRSSALPEDHPDLQEARSHLAMTLRASGDLAGARELLERVLEVRLRTLPEDHLDVQRTRQSLAATVAILGDLAGARALQERALEVLSRTLPEDDRDLQVARMNLAVTLEGLGYLAGARALCEGVLEVWTRTLPEHHPDIQVVRLNLAVTLHQLGDLAGARALQERVVEVLSRTLPEDHIYLLGARENLAITVRELGDLAAARALQERVLDVSSLTLPEDHPDLQKSRLNLAATIKALGDLAGARALDERVLEIRARTLPEDHPDLQVSRHNLADTLYRLGDLAGALELEERVLAVFTRTLPDEHPDLQAARKNLAMTIAASECLAGAGGGEGSAERAARRERCADLVAALGRAQAAAARAAVATGSAREAEERCARIAADVSTCLSFAAGYGVFEPLEDLERAAFELGEALRTAGLATARGQRLAGASPRYVALRDELRGAALVMSELARQGNTREEFRAALARRERLERELAELSRELAGGVSLAALDAEDLAAALPEGGALVGFQQYVGRSLRARDRADAPGRPALEETSVARLCALVLRGGGGGPARLARVELGELGEVEAAVGAWREAVGVTSGRGVGVALVPGRGELERGMALRALVLDPVLAAAGGAARLVIALEGPLHLVPLDALPLDAQGARVGDRVRIETRAALAELLAPPSAAAQRGSLLALGGASFDAAGLGPEAEEPAQHAEQLARSGARAADILRGSAWERGFEPLAFTREEARGVAALFAQAFDSPGAALVLDGRRASRASLEALAPRARWLHVATHGWFAPESIRSWSDHGPMDRNAGLGTSDAEQVRGMSPMLLCGLALSGANLPVDGAGRAPGLLTAEELAMLDLSACELAVLSACDTARGEARRSGQGVASLQKALQMAGARSVITSLWKVPDEATKELMLDFYRRLWIERQPKAQALWEAKRRLRDATDERGEPRYGVGDWAAWVLTGEPD